MRWCSRFAVAALLMGASWMDNFSINTGTHVSTSIGTGASTGIMVQAHAQEKTKVVADVPSGVYTAVITAYCPCVKCCGDYEGKIRGKTASGKMAQPCRTIAAPKNIPFGAEIYIVEGDGGGGRLAKGVCLGIVEDRGGAISWRTSKTTGKPVLRLDVYFRTHDEALEFGIRSAEVQVRIEKGESK